MRQSVTVLEGRQRDGRDRAQELPDARVYRSKRQKGCCAGELKPVAPPEHVRTKRMFMTPGEMRGCSSEELTIMLAETEKEYKYWRKLARVRDAVSAHRLEQMRDILAQEQMKTWRSKNGLDRDDSWMYGTRPLSPQEFTASLWAEVNELKAAISMPVRGGPSWQEYKRNINRKIERGEVSDEDFAVIKRLVETRDRDAAQVTVTQVSTVHRCSHIPQTPEPPSGVCFNLENNEGEMDPGLKKEPKSPSAGTGLETPGQQCPPNEGVWEQRRTTANGFVTAGMDSSQGGRTPSPPERSTSTRTFADIFSTAVIQENRRCKTSSQQNKQFDPGGRGEKAPPWNAAVALPFLFRGRAGKLLACFSVCASFCCCSVCVCFPKLFFFHR